MNSVLVVSYNDKGKDVLVNLLKAHNFLHITTAKSGEEARRLLNEKVFELIAINTPLSDETGEQLALTAIEMTIAGVLLLVKAEIADDVSAKVEDYGVVVLAKPINRQLFFQTVKLVSASQKRLLGLKNENIKLQQKIEEIRLVDRAKCALIQYLNFTEPQAHRHIEKQAMDRRVTKREVAEGILNSYEW